MAERTTKKRSETRGRERERRKDASRPENLSDEKKREERDIAANQPSGSSSTHYDKGPETSTGNGGPSPYDVASPGMPEDRVIKKGEREKPGPTADEMDEDLDAEDSFGGDRGIAGGPADEDGLLQSNEMDRGGNASMGRRGYTADTGDLGGEELHRRLNNEVADADDEELQDYVDDGDEAR